MSRTTRDWQIIYFDQQHLTRDFKVEIYLKSRNEAPLPTVPERLFSSLKYEIRHKISGSFIKDIPLLMCKIRLVHPETGQEVLSRKEKEPILKGVTEGALTRDQNGELVFRSKVQITDVTFHYGKKYFEFQILYYVPTKLEAPVLIIQSAPFQVYARRVNGRRKRKREPKPQPYIAEYPRGIAKKQKRPTIQDFLRGLDELIILRSKLRSDLQRKAVEAIVRKLLLETPERKPEIQPHIQAPIPQLPIPQEAIPPPPFIEQMPELDISTLFADFDKLLEKEYNSRNGNHELIAH